jgi:predicted acylesterase/phospholipase RssA
MTGEIRNIVFSGGGITGLAYFGVIGALEEKGQLDGIRQIAGCSSGALTGLLLALRYTYEELKIVSKYFDYREMLDIQILGLVENLGIETGRRFMRFIGKLMEHKIGVRDVTFRDLYAITGRRLIIAASCVDTDQPCYFSVDSHPNMSVMLALRMSIAIPGVFTAVRHDGKVWVDGGVHDHFPVTVFPVEGTLGVRLVNSHDIKDTIGLPPIINHMLKILMSFYLRTREYKEREIKDYTTLDIVTDIKALEINLSRKNRSSLIKKGYEATIALLK